jgi:hypothetical protein
MMGSGWPARSGARIDALSHEKSPKTGSLSRLQRIRSDPKPRIQISNYYNYYFSFADGPHACWRRNGHGLARCSGPNPARKERKGIISLPPAKARIARDGTGQQSHPPTQEKESTAVSGRSARTRSMVEERRWGGIRPHVVKRPHLSVWTACSLDQRFVAEPEGFEPSIRL